MLFCSYPGEKYKFSTSQYQDIKVAITLSQPQNWTFRLNFLTFGAAHRNAWGHVCELGRLACCTTLRMKHRKMQQEVGTKGEVLNHWPQVRGSAWEGFSSAVSVRSKDEGTLGGLGAFLPTSASSSSASSRGCSKSGCSLQGRSRSKH